MATPKKTTSNKNSSAKTKASTSIVKPIAVKRKVDSLGEALKSCSASGTKIGATKSPVSVASSASKGLLGWLVAVLLGGALVGTYVSDAFWMQAFDSEEGMLVVDDRTWMPVGGVPISVVVLNDKNCGSPCETSASLNSLRASVNPALKVSEIDINSTEGQSLISEFDLVSIPQYFFGKDIEALEVEGPEGEDIRFIDNLPAGLLTAKNNLYYIDSARVGFKPGKFIKAPEFTDIESEPQLGNGPVKVVEFTNYQCSFCKRFQDQNKSLIDQLVADNKITYIVKDFPMFQQNDRFAHRSVNCVQRQGGNDAYWLMNASVFRTQSVWSQIADAETYFVNLATEFGYNISSCMSDAAIEAEIMADMAEGSKFGVTGTPTLFVGTQILPGAVGPAVLSAAVQAELEN